RSGPPRGPAHEMGRHPAPGRGAVGPGGAVAAASSCGEPGRGGLLPRPVDAEMTGPGPWAAGEVLVQQRRPSHAFPGRRPRQGGAMRRVLFQWRGVQVHAYPAMLYLGLVFGVTGGTYAGALRGLDPARTFAAMLLLVLPALA